MVFDIDPENIEGFHHVVPNLLLRFLFFNGDNQVLCHVRAAGIQFNQGIPTVLQQGFQALRLLGGGFNQLVRNAGIAINGLLP